MAVKDRSISQTLDLAKRAQRRGAIDKARAYYEQVLARFPANRRAKNGLLSIDAKPQKARGVDQAQVDAVISLYHAGDYDTALKQATALYQHAPDLAALSDIRAACLRALSKPEKALRLYQAALKSRPHDAQLWRNCGATLSDLQKLSEAEGCFVKASELAPDTADLWYVLAQCRERRGHHRPAYQAVTRAIELDPSHADALNLLGSLLRELGEFDLARRTHEQVLQNSRKRAARSAAQTNLGILAAAKGDTNAAQSHYSAAIETFQDNIQAHRNLARLTRYSAHHPHLATLRTLSKKANIPCSDRAFLHFAMFEALDQINERDEAFDHLKRGNELRHQQLRYDISRDAMLFKYLDLLTQDIPTPSSCTTGPRPIFIVGMPRSGTTLTERILSGASQVQCAGEIPSLGIAASAVLRQVRDENRKSLMPSDLTTLETSLRSDLALYAPDRPTITCKTPLDFRWAGLALAAMPDAKVVHIVRDPMETCWSNYRTCFTSNGNGFAYDQKDLGAFYHLHADLMQTWKNRFPDRILTVPYAELVAEFETQARGLVSFCGLDWSDDCLRPDAAKNPVLTASAAQARRPLYNGNQRDWQRYEGHLATLIEGLAKKTRLRNNHP